MTGRGRSRGQTGQQQADSQARTGGGRGRVQQSTPFVAAAPPVIHYMKIFS